MKMMPTLQRLMYYYNEIAVSEDGPLGDLHDYLGVYAFIDYGSFERRGITTALNGLYCRALLSASWLSEMSGQEELAAVYREQRAGGAGRCLQGTRQLRGRDNQLAAMEQGKGPVCGQFC